MHIVADLHQVINFGVGPNGGAGNFRAVYTGVGLDFHVRLYNHITDLRDFLVAAFVEGKTKAVGTDFGAGLQNNKIFQNAVFADDHLRVNQAVFTDFYILPDVALGVNDGVIANDGAVFHHAVGTYRHVGP